MEHKSMKRAIRRHHRRRLLSKRYAYQVMDHWESQTMLVWRLRKILRGLITQTDFDQWLKEDAANRERSARIMIDTPRQCSCFRCFCEEMPRGNRRERERKRTRDWLNDEHL